MCGRSHDALSLWLYGFTPSHLLSFELIRKDFPGKSIITKLKSQSVWKVSHLIALTHHALVLLESNYFFALQKRFHLVSLAHSHPDTQTAAEQSFKTQT